MKTTASSRLACAATLASLTFAPFAGAALLVHYPFDGDENDATGNAGPAALANGAVINPTGKFGGALDVTAGNSGGATAGSASQAVVAGGTHLDSAVTNNAMAVSFHQFNNAAQNSSAFWVHSVAAGANDRGFQAHTPWGNGTIFFDQSGCCDPPQRLTADGQISLGQWQHLVFQRDAAGEMEIWVDGVLAASSSGAEALDPFNGIITIGSEGNTASNGFDGLIDDFAIFDETLTPDEIQFLSNNPVSAIPEPGSALLGLLSLGMLLKRRRR